MVINHQQNENCPKIANRTIGVEVHCGPIKGMFLYHAGDFIAGGANLMIEIQHQAMSDLTEILKQRGMKLPKHGMFQFDNCGENKVLFALLYLFLIIIIIYKIKLTFRTKKCSCI